MKRSVTLNLAAAKIWLCLEPTDMRKSFDTLAARVREHLKADPMPITHADQLIALLPTAAN